MGETSPGKVGWSGEEDRRLAEALAGFGVFVALPLDGRRRAEYRTMLARYRRARARRLAYLAGRGPAVELVSGLRGGDGRA
jgi:hypothetical protein